MELSGGMKRRVMIAKALCHEPELLFLDEPTAGVDVELRRDMWELVRRLREGGVTIVLTTHYIEEAEEMADRVGVISQGRADPGRGEGRLDEEARPQGADPEPHRRDGRGPARARRVEPRAAGRRPRTALRVRRQCRAHRRPLFAAADERPRHRLQGPAHPPELARGHLRQPRPPAPRGGGAHELQLPWRLGDLPVRDGARHAHALAEPGHAGHHHLALFRRVRRRDRRQPQPRGDRRRRPMARSSCPG